MNYTDKETMVARLKEVDAQYAAFCAKGLKLDMSRGKPTAAQISVSDDMLLTLKTAADCRDADGFDVRNYGLLEGIPEARKLFGDLLGVPAERVFVGGSSSLSMMYDTVAKGMTNGFPESERPWAKEEEIKFLCPCPGYDRHFTICQSLGIKMIPVPMTDNGPDMDLIEELVKDKAVRGMWCVPKYSNPDGITYSDETVRRIAALKPAAPDFKIMWDNAYLVHDIDDTPDTLLNIFDACRECGSEEMVIEFCSTSKITFPGAGVAAMAAGEKTYAHLKKLTSAQSISADKVNQLRHVRYFGTAENLIAHMKKHAEFMKPRFDVVTDMLESKLAPLGIGWWRKPHGGYFVSYYAPKGCAKRIVALAKEAGVVMTGAGASYPYGNDPDDSNIRIAPSFVALDDLRAAMELFCVAAEKAALEQALNA